MKRSHHTKDPFGKTLTYWKVSNFIAECLGRGYHIAYYHDTNRIHYWKPQTDEYHIMNIDYIHDSQTGLGIGNFNHA